MRNISNFRLVWQTVVLLVGLSFLCNGTALAVKPTEEVLNDPRFKALEAILGDSGLELNHKPKKPKVVDVDLKKNTLLFSAYDSDGEEAGLLTVYNDFYGLSIVVDNEASSYYAEIDKNGNVAVTEDSIEPETEALGGGPQWSYNWCIYVSRLSISFACWNPEDNPFGYYFVSTYRQGDPITPYWQAWWADYRRNIAVCPRNEMSWSPFLWTQCGFPPY